MSQRSYRILLWCASVFGVLCFIFAHSLSPASSSSEESRSFLDVLRVLFPSLTHRVVRKLAHFAEYALLGAHFALLPYLSRMRTRILYPSLLFCGIPVALVDEGIQRFVPGRGASLVDVLIDFLGYLSALVFVFALLLFLKRRKKNA